MRDTTLDGLVLTLGDQPCVMCRDSEFPGQRVRFRGKPCTKCAGTGRRGGGRCRACKNEFSSNPLPVGEVADYDQPYPVGPCGYCDGNLYRPATMTDSLPAPIARTVVDTIGVRVHIRKGELSYGETLIGMVPPSWEAEFMPLWTSTDYGRTFERLTRAWQDGDGTEEERAARVRVVMDAIGVEIGDEIASEERVQACKVVHDDGVLAGQIVVLLARNGYTVIAASRPAEERAAILAARSVDSAVPA